MTFQQPLPPPLFSALRVLVFPVDTVSGEALENEKTTANERIARMPGVKLPAFTMVYSSLLPGRQSNLRVPVTREGCQDF
jgi:hypothetical protein